MKLTLGTTYYNSPDELKVFISNHIDYVDELIVVDDGSPIYPAIDYILRHPKIRLYRVLKDYGFNSHGCRNLIMKETSNDWVILLDIDRKFRDPKLHIETIRNRKLKENTLYRFLAFLTENEKIFFDTVHSSVNDYLINKNHFFSAGGYDEELISHRNGDRQYFEQLKHYGKEFLMHDVELLLMREATTFLKNKKFYKSPNDLMYDLSPNVFKLLNSRMKKPDPNKPILTFKWERVF